MQARNAFKDLLFVDTVRGLDSTGVFTVNAADEVNVLKRTVDGPVFIQLNQYAKVVHDPFTSKILAGHNRWATKGAVNHDNAHPFHHGDVIMMHNGTLKSGHGLTDFNSFRTDSEAIAYNLSLVEPKDAGKVISDLHGAFALVWYDCRDKSLNFIRNSERELYIASDNKKETKAIVWASEPSMINFAINRPNRDLTVEEPELLEEMQHYKMKFTKEGISATRRTVKAYSPPVAPPRNAVTYLTHQDCYGGRVGTALKKGSGGGSHIPPKHYPKPGEVIDVAIVSYRAYSKGKGLLSTKGCILGLVERQNRHGKFETITTHLHDRTKEEFDEAHKNDLMMRATVLHTHYDGTSHIVSAMWKENVSIEQALAQEEAKTLVQKEEKEESKILDNRYQMAYDNEIEPNNLQDRLDFIPGPGNRLLTYKEYSKLTSTGCANCSTNLFLCDADDIEWRDENTPLCIDCQAELKTGEL